MWVKIIIKIALKESTLVVWMGGEMQMIQSVLSRFLVFSLLWALPGRDNIFVFCLRLAVVLLMVVILRGKD